MRVSVSDSDGIVRGGFLTVEAFLNIDHRSWQAPPHPHYTEYLVQGGYDHWYVVRLSKTPRFDRPAEQWDAYDEESLAIGYSDEDARQWFERSGFAVPADLSERISAVKEAGGHRTVLAEIESAQSLDEDTDPLARLRRALAVCEQFGAPTRELWRDTWPDRPWKQEWAGVIDSSHPEWSIANEEYSRVWVRQWIEVLAALDKARQRQWLLDLDPVTASLPADLAPHRFLMGELHELMHCLAEGGDGAADTLVHRLAALRARREPSPQRWERGRLILPERWEARRYFQWLRSELNRQTDQGQDQVQIDTINAASSAKSGDDELSTNEELLLQAVVVRGIIGRSKRKSLEWIVENNRLGSDANNFKAASASLVKRGLLESKPGPKGGVWATDKGVQVAQALGVALPPRPRD